MKKILVLVIFLVTSLIVFSQNGGQFFENNVIKVFYLGYSSGLHTFRVCNKQNCEARIRTKADQDPAIDIQVKADSCVIVSVSRPTPLNVKFRAKAETSCPSFTNPDMGWLELNTSDFVLNLVEGNNITVIRGPDKLILLLENGIIKSSFGSRSYIEHIKIYTILGDVKFDNLTFVKRSNQFNLSQYLKRGLNIIEVIIVSDRTTDRFLFKYLNP